MSRFCLILLALCMSVSVAVAGDWPGFLGPDGNAVSNETGLKTDFGESGPKVLWRKALGEGFAPAAVVGDEVFIMDREESLRDVLRCLDLKTGEQKWSCSYEAPGKFSFNGSRSTPAVDAKSVFGVGPMGQLTCFDRQTHKIRWQKNLLADFDAKMPRWAVSQSPLLVDDMVIAAPQGAKASLAAFDKTDGKLLWVADPIGGGMNYTTPALMTICGVRQLVAICGNGKSGAVIGVNPADGKRLWKFTAWNCNMPIPGPTLMPGDRLFLTGGYNADSVIVQVSKADGTFSLAETQRIKETGSQIANALVFDGMLYVNCNTNNKKTGLACFNETGEMMWSTGQVGPAAFDRGNTLAVDGKLLILDSGGYLRIVQPDPYRYDELACLKLFDNGKSAWSPMAYTQGLLLIRNKDEMACVVMAADKYESD